MARMTRLLCTAALAVLPAAALQGLSAPPEKAPLELATPPEATRTVGTLRVERFGSGEASMILIPGLGCGSWVWRDTIERFRKEHSLYVVTLPGIDGTPTAEGPQLARAHESLLELVASEKLDRPVIVGHSLGGHLALRLAGARPDLVGGLFIVDAFPVFPAAASARTEAERKAVADSLLAQARTASEAEFARYQRMMLGSMITDPEVADRATALVLRSNRKAMLESAAELVEADLRPLLERLTPPVAVVMPVPTITTEFPESVRKMSPDEYEAMLRESYSSLYEGTPDLEIVPIRGARHFVMLDQPRALNEALARFAAAVRREVK